MIQSNVIETGLSTTSLMLAGIRIAIVFGALILGTARNPAIKAQLFSYTILGFVFSEATGLFAFILAYMSELSATWLSIIAEANNTLNIQDGGLSLEIDNSVFLHNTATSDPLNMDVPSMKCPTCASEGIEVWVIYGKCCPRCGTACD